MAHLADYLQVERLSSLELGNTAQTSIALTKVRIFMQIMKTSEVFPLATLCELQTICLETFMMGQGGPFRMPDSVTFMKISTSVLKHVEMPWMTEVATALNNSQAFNTVYDGRRATHELHTLMPDVYEELPWLSVLPFGGCASNLIQPVIVGGALSNLFHRNGYDDVDVFFILKTGRLRGQWTSKWDFECPVCEQRQGPSGDYHFYDYRIDTDGESHCMIVRSRPQFVNASML